MSEVSNCPTCKGKVKIKEKDGKVFYQAIQEEDLIKKVIQTKKAMQKFKAKAEKLEEELKQLRLK